MSNFFINSFASILNIFISFVSFRTVRYEVSDERKGRGDWTLVRDGTACGEKLICVNQTCESLYPFIEPGHCETNNNALECSGHGVSIN